MRAIDHYLEAEKLADHAKHQLEENGPETGAIETAALAQVHATLALAGATAMQAYVQGEEDELDDWQFVAGDPAKSDA